MEGNSIMALTTEQMDAKIMKLETQVRGLQEQINKLTSTLTSKAYTSDLRRTERALQALINDNSKLISSIEERLSKVILPEETRYYLDEGEVAQFQANFNKLRAMMSSFEKLYKNLVAYSSSMRSSI